MRLTAAVLAFAAVAALALAGSGRRGARDDGGRIIHGALQDIAAWPWVGALQFDPPGRKYGRGDDLHGGGDRAAVRDHRGALHRRGRARQVLAHRRHPRHQRPDDRNAAGGDPGERQPRLQAALLHRRQRGDRARRRRSGAGDPARLGGAGAGADGARRAAAGRRLGRQEDERPRHPIPLRHDRGRRRCARLPEPLREAVLEGEDALHRRRPPPGSGACFGDSGGPIVADTATGPVLVATVTAGDVPCGRQLEYHERIVPNLGFIAKASGVVPPRPASPAG